MTVKGRTAAVKYSKVRKKNQTLKRAKVITLSKAQGKVSYAKKSGNKKILVDKKTGKTQLSLEMQDPLVAYTVMAAVLDNLKNYMSEYRTSKSRQDVANLSMICEERKLEYYAAQQAYAQYTDSNKNIVQNSSKAEGQRLQQEMNLAYQVYSQVATQLEGARVKVQPDKPVFAILKPAVVPLKKAGPSKAKLLIGFAFIAGCCAAAWVLFGKDFWKQFKDNLK
jgi:hypothetical protein